MTKIKRPPEASRAGKNRHYHHCEPVGTSRHYGVCLFTIEAFERGQALNETACVKAMSEGTCPAMKMRQEERDAGEALYFVEPDPDKAVDPRAAQRERDAVNRDHPSYQRGRHGAVWGSDESRTKASGKASVAKTMPRKRAPDEMIEFDASKIVNSVKGERRTPEVIKEDMLELSRPAAARRRAAIDAGEAVKPSVFDYMTDAELAQLKTLKTEMNQARKQEAA